MINVDQLGARIIVGFGDGSIFLSESILWGFIIAVIIAALGIWMGHGLETVPTTKRQIAAELIVEKIYDYAKSNLGSKAETFAPYMGTIFLYILIGSSLGLFGIRPITADINVTFSLSLLTFLLIQISSFPLSGRTRQAQAYVRSLHIYVSAEHSGGLHLAGFPGAASVRQHLRRHDRRGALDVLDGMAECICVERAVHAGGIRPAAERVLRYI